MVSQFSSKVFSGTLYFTLTIGLLAAPVAAHEVEIAGDVAGTWHIEPNHNPKAGVPARTWIVLTRRGGSQIPLEQANCTLAVYTKPRQSGATPILRPQVKAVAAERYQRIPGANITFPRVGLYELELRCTPKSSGNFKPFQMKYDVTVTR